MGMGDDHADFKAWGPPGARQPFQNRDIPPPATPRPPVRAQTAPASGGQVAVWLSAYEQRLIDENRIQPAALTTAAQQAQVKAAIDRLATAAWNAGNAIARSSFSDTLSLPAKDERWAIAKQAQREYEDAHMALCQLAGLC